MRGFLRSVALFGALVLGSSAQAFEPSKVKCIAPADPGGGWDFTCRSVGRTLSELNFVPGQVTVTNMPGAGGGVAYSYVVGKRNKDNNLLVAASTATTSRLAQNQYAGLSADQARWIASLGADFGVIAVPASSPYKNLKDLMAAVKANPRSVAFGGASAVGGWDHMKVLLLGKKAGMDQARDIKYVSFNAGGNAITQLLGGHIDAFTGDLSEIAGQLDADKLRVVAVLADERLPEKFSNLPTAAEQGFDVVGANWRGFYMGGEVSDKAYNYWVDALEKLYKSEQWKQAMTKNGLVPFWRGGEQFDSFVKAQVKDLQSLSREIGVLK
jgi:putative tricarboxylic transport membrane protein